MFADNAPGGEKWQWLCISATWNWVPDGDLMPEVEEVTPRKAYKSPPLGYFTPYQAAKRLGIKNQIVYNWVRRKQIPSLDGFVKLEDVRAHKPKKPGWPHD